jgi:hypothetical protein
LEAAERTKKIHNGETKRAKTHEEKRLSVIRPYYFCGRMTESLFTPIVFVHFVPSL